MKSCKHKYKARYDKVWTTSIVELMKEAAKQNRISKVKSDNIKPYLKSKTYIHDICIRCGDIKKRNEQ